MGGLLGAIEQSRIEAVPIFHSDGGAAGFADQAAIITYRQELVAHLKKLHGKAFQQRSS
jgi:hypothetical protein